MVKYELIKASGQTRARLGRLHTPHGAVETPCFLPVATSGAVKTLDSGEVEQLGFGMVLANTYHLELRPGSERIERLGGLHAFMSWGRPILTDSGGFQVMSLAKSRSISDEGVRFRSHLDGNEMFLTPERAIKIQARLGVDISMALDECPPYPCEKPDAERAMARTHDWAARSLEARCDEQAIFGIVQGGVHEDLRRQSVDAVCAMAFDGFAIGGVSVGESTELQRPVVEYTAPLLPPDKARYLMGVGHPQDIIHAVACGIDMFDCVLPTRMARHHCLYTLQGRVNIAAAKWAEHDGPVDPESVFPATERYPAAYLRHLFNIDEPLAQRLATLHNLAFYARLMQEIRQAIEESSWPALVQRYANA